MEIDRSSAIPLWHQIATILEKEVYSSEVKPGEQFSTTSVLSDRFQVNRHTVRQALASLSDKGLIRTEKGYGIIIEEHAVDYAIGKKTRFSENLLKSNIEPSHDLINAFEAAAPDHVAEALKMKSGSKIAVVETVGFADDSPISVSSNYIPLKRFPDFIKVYKAEMSMTRSFKLLGVEDYSRKWSKILTRLPSSEDARWLKQPQSQPILCVESVDVDKNLKPIVFHDVHFGGGRVQLTIES